MIHETAFHGILSDCVNKLKFNVGGHIASNTTPQDVIVEVDDIIKRLETLRLKTASCTFKGSYLYDGEVQHFDHRNEVVEKNFLPVHYK